MIRRDIIESYANIRALAIAINELADDVKVGDDFDNIPLREQCIVECVQAIIDELQKKQRKYKKMYKKIIDKK